MRREGRREGRRKGGEEGRRRVRRGRGEGGRRRDTKEKGGRGRGKGGAGMTKHYRHSLRYIYATCTVCVHSCIVCMIVRCRSSMHVYAHKTFVYVHVHITAAGLPLV